MNRRQILNTHLLYTTTQELRPILVLFQMESCQLADILWLLLAKYLLY